MIWKNSLTACLKYSVSAAILYGITAGIFIYKDAFTMSYLLYAGNMLFAGCIAVFIWFYSKKRMDNPSAGSMVLAGNIATVTGVIMACIISLVLLLVIAPGAFNGATQTDVLKQAPSQLQGKNRGFIIILFMNAVIGNASAGAFISIILPYIAKRDQKGDTSQTKNKFN